MSIQLRDFFVDALKLTIKKHEHDKHMIYNTPQECQLTALLEAQGFKSADLNPETKATLRRWIKDGMPIRGLDIIPPGSFVVQPLGGQAIPDIYLRDFDDRSLFIDGKYSKSIPMWNVNQPKSRDNAIYVFSHGDDGTTFFLGRDYITLHDFHVYERMNQEGRAMAKRYAEQLEDKAHRGLSIYFRPMAIVSGAWANPLVHPYKGECEQNVLNFASDKPLLDVIDMVDEARFVRGSKRARKPIQLAA